ncbi:hypothetical protein HYN59_04765 [Flavobacterium album]|uniref:Uncharacterized protein n=1 Tax=Flavobacterium album TaxID=2175091 RepID=A0A2S1QW60_9FLAO|nr:hypothetical protein [Flavobacterium album]AWH84471.1 hypothetical protein HYN59_04765 [Flavobacterium album]
MALNQYRLQITALLFGIVFYAVNRLIFLLPDFSIKYTAYHHSLEVLYLFFITCAVILITVLLKVYKHSMDNTGYVFIGATLVQMGLCYLMLKPILEAGEGGRFEKMNFFFIFILFLTIETVLTIRLLNKKQ